MIVASEVLPKCADGSTPHRVPLFVYRDVSGKPKTAFYTEYPAAEAFVDLPRGWVPGPPRARRRHPRLVRTRGPLGHRWVERLAIHGRGQGVSLWHRDAPEASRPAGPWRAHEHAGGKGRLGFRRGLATDHVAPARLVRALARSATQLRPRGARSPSLCPRAGWRCIASSGGSAT